MQAVRNIGGVVTTKVALTPRNQADAAAFGLVGATIYKKDAASALFVVNSGPFAGTANADSVAISYKLQESALNADGTTPTAWTDVATSATNPAVTGSIAAPSARSFLEVDLTKLKEAVRLVFTVAHTGGTAPVTGLAAECVLGGLLHTPPTHA